MMKRRPHTWHLLCSVGNSFSSSSHCKMCTIISEWPAVDHTFPLSAFQRCAKTLACTFCFGSIAPNSNCSAVKVEPIGTGAMMKDNGTAYWWWWWWRWWRWWSVQLVSASLPAMFIIWRWWSATHAECVSLPRLCKCSTRFKLTCVREQRWKQCWEEETVLPTGRCRQLALSSPHRHVHCLNLSSISFLSTGG